MMDAPARPPHRGAGGPAVPLPADTADPVVRHGCGNIFGRGAEAGTVCPYCAGAVHPLPGARQTPGDPAGGAA